MNSPGLVIFPKVATVERPLYLKPHESVNTILTHFLPLPT